MRQTTTILYLAMFLPTFACDKGDDSAGESDADTDTDSDTDTDTDTDTDVSIEIAGSWIDAFGAAVVITDDTWTTTYQGHAPLVVHLTSYDNGAHYAIGQNDNKKSFNPSLWSRFDWAWDGTDLYFCQTAYDAASEAAAEATPAADSSDLTKTGTGCNGFPWSPLTAN